MVESIQLNKAELSLIERGGIIHIRFEDGIILDLNMAINIEHAIIKLADNEMKYILVDTRYVLGELENEAKNYLSKSTKLKKIRMGQAFVVDSLSNRLIGTFYSKLFRKSIPSKVFGNYEAALNWLKSLEI